MEVRLTNEQRKFAEENIALVYHYIHKNNIDEQREEDLVGEFLLEYCKAILKFDPSKGNFSTFLYKTLDNKWAKVYTYRRSKCRYTDEPPLSLNVPQHESEDGGVTEDICIEYTDERFEIVEAKDACQSIARILEKVGGKYSHKQYISTADIFRLLSKGYTRKAISKEYGISQQAISKRVLNIIKPIWKMEMGECM